MMREFNTLGPCRPARHYTVLCERLLDVGREVRSLNSTARRHSCLCPPTIQLSIVLIVWLAFSLRFYALPNHPLGIFFDPAINGLDAVRLMERGGHVLFFPTNGGRESLFMYLLIPFITLFDTTPFALRALTATFSLLNVVILYRFLRDVGPQLNLPPTLPLLATFAIAVSYWHISVSRLGQRPIMVPLIATLTFWLFVRAWSSQDLTRRKNLSLIGAGIALGLSAYTYSAARLIPVILGLALLPELWMLRRSNLRGRVMRLLIFSATVVVVASPILLYFQQNPAQFTARAGSVMVWHFLDDRGAIMMELARNAGRVANFFCCVGSPNPIFGLPNYPGLPLVLTPFLSIGLLTALYRAHKFFYRLIGLWWLIGVAPSIIAIESPHPLRMIVAVVPTAILVGLGLSVVLTLRPYSLPKPVASVLMILPIILPLPFTLQAYFVDWTALPSTRGVYDYGAVAIRNEILARSKSGAPIYLPQSRFNDSTLLFYLSGQFKREARLTVPLSDNGAVIISPEGVADDKTWVRLGDGRATVLPPLTANGQAYLREAVRIGQPIQTADGEIVARVTTVDVDPVQWFEALDVPQTAQLGPLALIGATYSLTGPTQAQFPVTLFWQATQPTPHEYEILVRLVDDQQQVYGAGDARPTDWVYPTSFWRPNDDQLGAQHLITVGRDRPPGRYWLAVSAYDVAQGKRLSVLSDNGRLPDTVLIGPLKVPLPVVPPLNGHLADFGPHIRLVAAEVSRPTAEQRLTVALRWQASHTPDFDYTVFVHVLDEADQIIAGNDRQPVNGQYPTTIWSVGEQVVDVHQVALPVDLPRNYRVAIGLYHQPTGQRLPITLPNGDAVPDARLFVQN